jgi:hypothetical protein
MATQKTADNGSSCLQNGLKMNKMADVPPSEKKKKKSCSIVEM